MSQPELLNRQREEPLHGVTRVDKPWGYEMLFARTGRYAGKILFIRAGESLSLQYHKIKEETIWVESGLLKLQFGETGRAAEEKPSDPLREMLLSPGEAWHVPVRTRHRFVAEQDTRLFEVSTPDLDDVVRLEDRYGRQGTSEP